MKHIAIFAVIAFFTLTISSCKSKKEIKSIPQDSVRFVLAKGACFGKCPMFRMEIFENGYATFEGLNYTDKQGTYDRRLSKEKMNELIQAFEKAEFSSMDDEYKRMIADLPMITIGYDDGSGLREIKGKENRPESLKQLQFLLEKIADSAEWNLLKAQTVTELDHTKKPNVSTIYSEVIIEPMPGVFIPKWIEANSAYGVRLVKKIAPALNYFLITYDDKKIKPEDFLQLLKDDENIKTAEFNKKTKSRG